MKCSICEVTYGIRIGNMPKGTMEWRLQSSSLPGFKGYGTIQFSYNFPNGTLADGTRYSGTGRTAFLPASPEGIVIFKMMITAFERRLSFTVGTSLTTGATDSVVWAGIHHKTSAHGGMFGYPDNTYLGRVTEEFKVRNIDAKTVENMDIDIKKGKINVK